MQPIRRFALIGHPRSNVHLYNEIERKLLNRERITPADDAETQARIEQLAENTAPFITDFIEDYGNGATGIVSGMHIGVPITHSIIRKAPKACIRKIDQAIMLSWKAGATVAVLGGLTSGLYRKGGDLSSPVLPIAITSGSALTSAAAAKMIQSAASRLGVTLASSTVAVVGASGEIGRLISAQLCQYVRRLHLIAPSRKGLDSAITLVAQTGGSAEVVVFTDLLAGIEQADVIAAAASTSTLPIETKSVKVGAIVCDVGYPRNIGADLCRRQDIFAFRGGLIKLPWPLPLTVDTDLSSSQLTYGCFAEAIVIALSGAHREQLGEMAKRPLSYMKYIYNFALEFGLIEACPFTTRMSEVQSSNLASIETTPLD
jgi:fatty aldehyde-generating acyl-ACP reductase